MSQQQHSSERSLPTRKFRRVPTQSFSRDAVKAHAVSRFPVWAETNRGGRTRNDDRFTTGQLDVAAPPGSLATPKHAARLVAVADGMGGHRDGNVASAIALVTLARALPGLSARWKAQNTNEIEADLVAAIHSANQTINQVGRERREFSGRMGTTVTAAILIEDRLVVGHAGDSRCYLWHRGALQQLTTDHSVEARLEAMGLAAQSERSGLIWNAVGAGTEELCVQTLSGSIEPGDVVLLCTDGLTNVIGDDEMADAIAGGWSCQEIGSRILTRALSRKPEDNLTLAVASVK